MHLILNRKKNYTDCKIKGITATMVDEAKNVGSYPFESVLQMTKFVGPWTGVDDGCCGGVCLSVFRSLQQSHKHNGRMIDWIAGARIKRCLHCAPVVDTTDPASV